MSIPFLTAEWRNLVLLTWDVKPSILQKRLAGDLELDTRDGRAFVSLVAFDFLSTRVLGVPWPGFRNFPEVNLRFYVKRKNERGVMFVREFVPQRTIAMVAKALYNEPYSSARMQSRVRIQQEHLLINHRMKVGGRDLRIAIQAEARSTMRDEKSLHHFFKEHQWGYGRSRGGKMIRYEVRHPHWRTHEIIRSRWEYDFGALYGKEFAELNDREPISQFVAAGSPVAVYFKGTF